MFGKSNKSNFDRKYFKHNINDVVVLLFAFAFTRQNRNQFRYYHGTRYFYNSCTKTI